jgi:hypothetical protein
MPRGWPARCVRCQCYCKRVVKIVQATFVLGAGTRSCAIRKRRRLWSCQGRSGQPLLLLLLLHGSRRSHGTPVRERNVAYGVYCSCCKLGCIGLLKFGDLAGRRATHLLRARGEGACWLMRSFSPVGGVEAGLLLNRRCCASGLLLNRRCCASE